MLDVAGVTEAILERESITTKRWISKQFGLNEAQVVRWLSTLVGLHDFGKAIPGFQVKWPEGQAADERAGLIFRPTSLAVDRHDLASGALLLKVLGSRYPGKIWVHRVIQALAAHHGYMPSTREMQAKPRYEEPVWEETRQALFDAYWHTLASQGEPENSELSLPACVWLAGLTSLCDWIGSNIDWFPPGERDDSLWGHFQNARQRAEVALNEIGWPHFSALLEIHAESDCDNLLDLILNRTDIKPRPLQQVADRMLLQSEGPTLMIVEAPMGEGKTELAFLAHLRLQTMNQHRGLYVALPTQATGNAMFERALTFLRAFSRNVPLDIQLAHGGALLDERVLRLREVYGEKRDAVSCSAWFSKRKRSLLSPYGVGTVDQALFSTLNVKHHFVRLWGLANRVVVLDEVHAYDTYTSSLIESLLRWLKAMNCSVVLMSATLPDSRRTRYLRSWGAEQESECEYPRILMTCGRQTLVEHIPCRPLDPIQIIGIGEALETVRDVALESLAGGGCGVVILNTVQRAQELYCLLQDKLDSKTELLLFHARYPADERGERERRILRYFGHCADSRRPERTLLIATQVVEQSLDVDFDFMITDLAPVDLLLQRAGRLHRHLRPRPTGHHEPRLIVAGFQRDREPDLINTAWGFVYDPYVLYRTWGIAGKEAVWRLPQDIDRLVQAVYGGEPFEEEAREDFVKKLDRALGEHLAETQKQRQQSINVSLDAASEPQNAYTNKPRVNEEGEGDGLPVVTRLGENSLSVVPVHLDYNGWRLLPGEPSFDPQAEIDDELARRLFQRQVRLSRKDLVIALAGQRVPSGFESHPLLRHLKPLLLTDGKADFGKLRVRIDAELGIIYETLEAP